MTWCGSWVVRRSESAEVEREDEETCLTRTTDNKSNQERYICNSLQLMQSEKLSVSRAMGAGASKYFCGGAPAAGDCTVHRPVTARGVGRLARKKQGVVERTCQRFLCPIGANFSVTVSPT